MGNWEKRSQYLLTEIVKYDSYIDSLQAAMSLRLKKRGEKALERALVHIEPEGPSRSKWKGRRTEDTIEEGDEPPLTPALSQHGGNDGARSHRREAAHDPD